MRGNNSNKEWHYQLVLLQDYRSSLEKEKTGEEQRLVFLKHSPRFGSVWLGVCMLHYLECGGKCFVGFVSF